MLSDRGILKYLLLLAVCLKSRQVTATTQCDIQCSYTREEIDEANCFGRQLTKLPAGCEDALILQAGRNNITKIVRTTFRGFDRLEYLYIKNSNVARIAAGAFRNLGTTLKFLDLSTNRLTVIVNGTFASMSKLEQLDLKQNRINRIASHAFEDLPALTDLFLSDNAVGDLPSTTFDGLPSLRKLRLKNNRLLEVDSRLFLNLDNLTHLTLTNNTIESLRGSNLTLTRLESIALSLNNISTFNCSWIAHMSSLTLVNLSHNSIQNIVDCQSRLNVLSLDHNPFDCSCKTKDLAEIYKANLLLEAPTCHNPPSTRDASLRDIDFEDCYSSDTSTMTPTKLSRAIIGSTISYNPKNPDSDLTTSTKIHQKTPSQIGSATGKFQSLTNKQILYPLIAGIGMLLIIIIALLIHWSKKKPRETHQRSGRTSDQSLMSRGNPSTSDREGSKRHIYQEIPGQETRPNRLDQNSNVLPSHHCGCRHDNGQYYTRHSTHHHLSDSQDSGLDDQCRNSLSDWIQNHVQYISVTDTSSSSALSQMELNTAHPRPPQHSHTPCRSQLSQPSQPTQLSQFPSQHSQLSRHPQLPRHPQDSQRSQLEPLLQAELPPHCPQQTQYSQHSPQQTELPPQPTQHSQSIQNSQHIAQKTTPHRTLAATTHEKRAPRRCHSCSCHRNKPRECNQPVSPQLEPLLYSLHDHRNDPDNPQSASAGYVPHGFIA